MASEGAERNKQGPVVSLCGLARPGGTDQQTTRPRFLWWLEGRGTRGSRENGLDGDRLYALVNKNIFRPSSLSSVY